MSRRLSSIAIALMLLGACASSEGGDGSPTTTAGGSEIAALNAADAALLPDRADELPETDPARFRELISQLRGTPVLVNVWGSWCPPCRKEAPALRDASEEYGERVQFLGLDILDDRASARAFMREFGWRYPSLFDVAASVRDDWGRIGQPITRLYDRSGEVVWERVGEVSLEMLERELERVI